MISITTLLIGLGQNIALLLALTLSIGLISSRMRSAADFIRSLIFGALFGAGAFFGMSMPVQVAPDIVIDGQVVIAGIAGAWAGPLSAILSGGIISIGRFWMGGAGTTAGIAAILTASLIGVVLFFRQGPRLQNGKFHHLMLLGLALAAQTLLWDLLFSASDPWAGLKAHCLPVLLFYPMATLFLGRLLSLENQWEDADIALKESEERYKSLFQNNHSVMLLIDPLTARIVDANPAACGFYGYSRRTITRMKITDINILPNRHFEREIDRAAEENPNFYFFRHKLADGTIRDVEVHSGPITVNGKELLFSIVHDHTERKQAEDELRETRDKLELRVAERTQELARTNQALKRQIARIRETKLALRESEKKYSTLVESALVGVYIVQDGKIEFANPKFADMFGYTRKELIGMNSLNLIHPEDRERVRKIREMRLSGKPAPEEYECRCIRKTGEVIHTTRRNTLIRYRGKPAVSGNLADVTKRRQIEEALRESEKELKILSSQLLTAEETERKRIARELHDSIGQALSAIKFGVETSLGNLKPVADPSTLKILKAVIPIAQGAIEEVRRIVKDLRPSILDNLGILATIGWVCREFQNVYTGITIDTAIHLDEKDIPEHLRTVIYRVLLEALNNVAKHSGASEVRLGLEKSDGVIRLSIQDNGRGFNLAKIIALGTARRGFGLASMRERTELTSGKFAIQTSPSGGTRIQACWPIETPSEAPRAGTGTNGPVGS